MIEHKSDYSILALLSTTYLVIIFRYQTYPRYIMLGTIIFSLSYLSWGFVHHLRAHNFHLRVVLEYLLIAILGIVIISSLLL